MLDACFLSWGDAVLIIPQPNQHTHRLLLNANQKRTQSPPLCSSCMHVYLLWSQIKVQTAGTSSSLCHALNQFLKTPSNEHTMPPDHTTHLLPCCVTVKFWACCSVSCVSLFSSPTPFSFLSSDFTSTFYLLPSEAKADPSQS